MKRIGLIWVAFGLCLALMLAAVAWLSVTVVRLERAEQSTRRQAAIEEDVRLALWRADSMLAALIAQESARPYFVYDAFHPAAQAWGNTGGKSAPDASLVPSSLLVERTPYVRLHFQIAADGTITSPQVPPAESRPSVTARFDLADRIADAEAALRELRPKLDYPALAAGLPLERPAPLDVQPPQTPFRQQARGQQAAPQLELAAGEQQAAAVQQQVLRNAVELQARNRAMQQFEGNAANQYVGSSLDITEGALQAVWRDEALLLARRVAVGGMELVQGCWLDWPAIAAWLGGEIADLFPAARFMPRTDADAQAAGRVLAALPVRLEPGPPATAPILPVSPTRWLLLSAWVGVVLAAAAVAALLAGVVSLSERRAAFVSAVTHELRTPLTTFRLYSDLLAGGMAADENKRRQYLRTLSAEAVRLAHLVENVLTFARLERGRHATPVVRVPLAELWQSVRERLSERAEQAGMTLEITPLPEKDSAAHVRAASGAVEQILFNLVDNACKYAGDGDDNRIELAAVRGGGAVRLRVLDHGPGIPECERGRLFQPFHKSARDAANSAPGVGLGLALSRRLARSLGGELALARSDAGGACFELLLREA